MDHERADCRWYCPDRELDWLDMDAVLIEKAPDEEDRADRDEDVLAEEERDVIHGRGVGSDSVSYPLRQLSVTILGGGLRHRRDEGAHHLRVSAERRESQRGGDLADREVDEENARCGGAAKSRDDGARPLLEPGVLQQSDHRQNQPHDADVAAGDEGFAERSHYLKKVQTTGNPGRQTGDGDNEEWVNPQYEAYDDDDYTDEWEHGLSCEG